MTPAFAIVSLRSGEATKSPGPRRILGIEQDDQFVSVIGRAKDVWIGEASRFLRSGVLVERWTPFAVVLHLMADHQYAHGWILLL
jgi:hypothetical protein